jgi:hypothetical protein
MYAPAEHKNCVANGYRRRASLGHATQTATTLAYISPRLYSPLIPRDVPIFPFCRHLRPVSGREHGCFKCNVPYYS